MRIRGNAARRVAVLALTALLVAGCGGAAPADSAPELAEQLSRVDRAVAAGDEGRIRERVESLASATEAARDDGTLDDEQAERILAAADALLARLPAEAPAPEPTQPTPTTSSPSPTPEEDEDDEEDAEEPAPEEKPDKPEKPDDHGKGKAKGHDDEQD